MFFFLLEVLGLFSLNCYEEGFPCGTRTDAQRDVLAAIDALICETKSPVTTECEALVKASEQEFDDLITTFVNTGEDVNFRSEPPWQYPLLIKVSFLGFAKSVSTLLENNAAPDLASEFGYTPLMSAAGKGRVEIVRILLDYGASVNLTTMTGGYALMDAILGGGHEEVVDILLDHGTMVNNRQSRGYTPLIYAAKDGHTGIVTKLLDHGAIPDIKTLYPDKNETALMKAAHNGHHDVVSVLLAHGATVDMKNRMDETALDIATQQGHVRVMEILLENGASPEGGDILYEGWYRYGEVPLIKAVSAGREDCVSVLLNHGARVEVKNEKGVTARKLAEDLGHEKIQNLLKTVGI